MEALPQRLPIFYLTKSRRIGTQIQGKKPQLDALLSPKGEAANYNKIN
jgi:hypothetical protein